MELHWGAVSEWMGGLLMERGTDRIAAEELTVPPGGDELFSLLVLQGPRRVGRMGRDHRRLRAHRRDAAAPELPGRRRWWLDKVLGKEQSMLNAARPLARMFLDVQLPDEKVIAEVQKLVGNLVAMHELLRDSARVSMRLVMTPDRMVVAEAMRTFTYLNLYGYLTDAVIVNRVFPDELAEGYFGAWHAVQREQLDLVGAGFSPVPILSAPYFATEVIGAERLDDLGDALFADHDPTAVLHDRLAQELSMNNGNATLRLDLPFAAKGDVKLKKIGLELIVRVDTHKRTIVLPGALAGYRPTSATLEAGSLTVGFEHG